MNKPKSALRYPSEVVHSGPWTIDALEKLHQIQSVSSFENTSQVTEDLVASLMLELQGRVQEHARSVEKRNLLLARRAAAYDQLVLIEVRINNT